MVRKQYNKMPKRNSKGNQPHEENTLSLYGSSYLDDIIHNLIERSVDCISDPKAEGQEFIKGIAEDFSTYETTRKTIFDHY